jgi:tetratricopeptide (TPR) repeat protein
MNALMRAGHSMSGGERNCAYLNTGAMGPAGTGMPRFVNFSAPAGLDLPDESRSVVMTDWDGDGDLDVWYSNRNAPRLRVMRNDLSWGGAALTVRLRGVSVNRDGIGATVELSGPGILKPLQRTLHAGDGFLSQSGKSLHFGLGTASGPFVATVRWPGGTVEVFKGMRAGGRHLLTQGGGVVPEAWSGHGKPLAEGKPEALPVTSLGRVVLAGRLPLPTVGGRALTSMAPAATGVPQLLVFWSNSCRDCRAEFSAWSQPAAVAALRASGLSVTALNVDELASGGTGELRESRAFLRETGWPMAARALTADETGVLDVFQRSFFSLRLPLPVPSAFLVDRQGRLAVIYRGPVEVAQVVKDGKLLDAAPDDWLAAAVPLPGRWESSGVMADPAGAARAFLREGFLGEGATYLERYLDAVPGATPPGTRWPAPPRLAAAAGLLADFQRLRGDRAGVDAAYRRALALDPGDLAALQHLGNVLARSGRLPEALPYLEKAAAMAPDDARILNDLGVARAMQNQPGEAAALFQKVTAMRPGFAPAHTNLGRLALQEGSQDAARQHLETAWRLAPGNRETARLLVTLYGRKGLDRPAEAVAVARLSLAKAQPAEAGDHELLAGALLAAGDRTGAAAALRKALSLVPPGAAQSPLATEWRKRLKALEGSP